MVASNTGVETGAGAAVAVAAGEGGGTTEVGAGAAATAFTGDDMKMAVLKLMMRY